MLSGNWAIPHFNPRSREGSDLKDRYTEFTSKKDFNPRSREGSDGCKCGTDLSTGISIHAPARGATNNVRYHRLQILHFNPRSREGSDF